MSKRGNGEGSIHRLPNGRWRAQLTIGFHPETGTQLRRYRTAATRKEVVAALDELRKRHAHLPLATAPQTLKSFADAWLATKASQVRPRTLDSYRGILERHVLPKFGRTKLEDIRTFAVQQHLDHLAATIGTRTANATRTVLKMMFTQAEKWDMIARNPMTGTEKKAHKTKPAVLWEADEVRRFLAVATNHRLYALFYLTMLSGVRLGEALGLRWTDLKGDTIIVSISVETRSGRVVENDPKSDAGRRIIALDAGTLAVLKEHRERQRVELAELGLQPDQQPDRIFTSRVGTTINGSNLYKVYRSLKEEAGVPHATFHDLRHMHLSRLVLKGVDIRTVADRAGHADPVLTMRQYVHAFDSQRKRGALPLEDLLDEG